MKVIPAMRNTKFSYRKTWYSGMAKKQSFDLVFHKQNSMIFLPKSRKSLNSAYENQGQMKVNPAMQNTKFLLGKTWYSGMARKHSFDLGFYKQNPMIFCSLARKPWNFAYKTKAK